MMAAMTTRHPNGFLLSQETIDRWTKSLVITMFVVSAIGIGLGVASDSDGAPEWLGTIATVVLATGIVGPLLAAGIMGGEAIRRGGGVIGVLVVGGLVGVAAGTVFESRWTVVVGAIALGLGIVGFWVIGWIAKVPMYVGLPWSHGRVVQRSDAPPGDRLGTDDPRLRALRPRAVRKRSR